MYFSSDLLTILRKTRNENYDFEFIDSVISYKDNKEFLFIDVSDKVDYISFIPNKKGFSENLTYKLINPTMVGITHDIYTNFNKLDIDKSKISTIFINTDPYKILGRYPAYGEWLGNYEIIYMENVNNGSQILNLQKIGEYANMEPILDKSLLKQELKIGRFLNKFTNVDNKTIESFVNAFKAINLFDKNIDEYFSVVKGDDIKFWYSKDNYASNCGILNNSCMRFDECQDYFNIYINNDVKMVILKDVKGKLLGRALLWETSRGKYIDRIYGQEHTIKAFEKWAIRNGYNLYFNKRMDIHELEVDVEVDLNKKFPYMDTFRYLVVEKDEYGNLSKGKLTQIQPSVTHYILGNTNGAYIREEC